MATRQLENDDDDFRPAKRFRNAKSPVEEEEMLQKAVPLSTRYKNSWAHNVFEEWRKTRKNKRAQLESSSFQSSMDSIEDLDVQIWENMSTQSLNFWIGKFVQEVANKKGSRYPGRTLYQLVSGLKRHLESKNRTDVNMLDKSNMR
jgi:hypothetical protein